MEQLQQEIWEMKHLGSTVSSSPCVISYAILNPGNRKYGKDLLLKSDCLVAQDFSWQFTDKFFKSLQAKEEI